MAATSTDIEIFAGAPAAEPPRPRVLLVGSALASGAAAMVVLALVGVYTRMRADVIAGNIARVARGEPPLNRVP